MSKIKHKIDILTFFQTGNFANLYDEQTSDDVLKNFAKPDSVWQADEFTEIWTYGNIELFFDKGQLFMIYTDHFHHDILHGGKYIDIKTRLFKHPEKLTLKNVIKFLLKHKIEFQTFYQYDLNLILQLKSKVCLNFELDSSVKEDQIMLTAFHQDWSNSTYRWKKA